MRTGIAAAGIAALLVLVGCSGGDDGSRGEGTTGASTQQSGGSAADLARLLPDAALDSMIITFGDVGEIAAANEVPVPADGDVDGLVAWAETGNGPGVPVLLPGQFRGDALASHDEYADELGVSLWGAQRYAGLDGPPTHVALLEGDDPGESISGALGDPDGDIWAIGDEGRIDLTQRSVARPTGEAVRLAVTESGYAIIASSETLARAGAAESPTLAVGELGAVIDQLADEEIVSGVIASADDGSSAPEVTGVGFGVDGAHGDGVFARLVLGYGDDERAVNTVDDVREFFTDGATSTGQAWSDLLTVADVKAAGGTVVVEATFAEGQSPQSLVTLIMQGPTGLPGR